MKRMILALLLAGTGTLTCHAQKIAADTVTKTTHDELGMTVVSAHFKSDTPDWVLVETKSAEPLRWVQLTHDPVPNSVRYRQMQQRKQIRQARNAMWHILWSARDYGRKNNQVGPAAVTDLSLQTQAECFESPWQRTRGSSVRTAANSEAIIESLTQQLKRTTERKARQQAQMKRDLERRKKQMAVIDAELKALAAKPESDQNKKALAAKRAAAEAQKRNMAVAQKRNMEMLARLAAEVEANKARIAAETKRLAVAKVKVEADREAGKIEKKQYFFLVPNVDLAGGDVPMVLELFPFVDDGKHYVGYSNGGVRRVAVDKALLKKHGLTLQPINPPLEGGKPVAVPYRIYAQLADAKAKTATLAMVNKKDPKQTLTVTIDLAKAAVEETSKDFGMWASLRARDWARHAAALPDSPCYYWLSRLEKLYGAEGTEELEELMELMGFNDGGRRRGRSVSMLNVIGGRAAIRETLQTQVIGVDKRNSGPRAIPISDIPGVEVKSHDYAEMLNGKPGGHLEIAELVPHDRLMVYFRRPADLADFLDTGDSFMYESGATASASCFDHGLKERYAEILGVGSGWGKIFLKSNLVNEIAAFAPDVFFVEGTDLTVIMNVNQMDLLSPMLATIGVKDLGNGNVVKKPGKDGNASYWYADKTYLIVSSSLREMAQVQKMLNGKGEGSLGKSKEFQYMLTKLPLGKSTWAFAYMSDPFIRHLVGPEVKIGQYRRLKAQAEMEALSAAALLYRADGHAGTPTIQRLVELGYASPNLNQSEFILHDDLSVTSSEYGRPSKLKSIQSMKVRKATEDERKAYGDYMRNYNAFWRQFFDPIAIRLDEKTEGELEMEIFILPLIDSSIYNSVRQFIGRPGQGPKMRVPVMTPPPVAMVSAKLQETVWMDALENFGTQAFEGFGIQNFPFDELGPSIHLAVMDGDPVVALGSGDIFGAFNGSARLFGRDSEMFLIPAVLSAVTRPCKLLVELRDAEKVKQSLRAALSATLRIDDEVAVSFAQIKGKDAWRVTFDIAGMVKMRFGLKVQNNYLVISNLPWKDAQVGKIAVEETLDSAGIQVIPSAGIEQLPGLYAAANSGKRSAVAKSAARLWPMMAAGAKDLNEARSWHQGLYGFTPEHPGKGSFLWVNGTVASDTFGSWKRQIEPVYTKGNTDFGLFGKIKILTLSMQLEDDGLRTRCRWKMVKPTQQD